MTTLSTRIEIALAQSNLGSGPGSVHELIAEMAAEIKRRRIPTVGARICKEGAYVSHSSYAILSAARDLADEYIAMVRKMRKASDKFEGHTADFERRHAELLSMEADQIEAAANLFTPEKEEL